MTFTQSVKTVFGKYAVFSGRASRSEYWYFVLFQCIVSVVLSLVFGLYDYGPDGVRFTARNIAGSAVCSLYSLATLLPGLGVSVRRMHDIGKGGGWIFISLVPLVGVIWFIVLAATPGERYANRFGNAPE